MIGGSSSPHDPLEFLSTSLGNDVLRIPRREGNTAKVKSYRYSILDPHGSTMQERPGNQLSAASGVLWGAGFGSLLSHWLMLSVCAEVTLIHFNDKTLFAVQEEMDMCRVKRQVWSDEGVI